MAPHCSDGAGSAAWLWCERLPECSDTQSCRVRLSATPRTVVAEQAPLSMGFSRQEYWSGLPCPSPGDLRNPRVDPGSPTLEADTLTSEPPGKPQQRSSYTYFKQQRFLIVGQSFQIPNPNMPIHIRVTLFLLPSVKNLSLQI